jgi:hypothetical protein
MSYINILRKILKNKISINYIMEFKIPLYYKINGVYKHSWFDGDYQYLTFELKDYIVTIKSIDDVTELIKDYKKPTEYVKFANLIKNYDGTVSNLLPLFKNKIDDFESHWENRKKGVPKHIIDNLLDQKKQFKNTIKRNLYDSMIFMKENITIIEDLVRDLIKEKQNKIKQSRKDANKKYYLKIKEELKATLDDVVDEAKVELNEEEIALKKIEARKETNRKYYQKIKDILQKNKPPATEEPVCDLKERRKLYNQKYYQARKEKILQLSKNENEQT